MIPRVAWTTGLKSLVALVFVAGMACVAEGQSLRDPTLQITPVVAGLSSPTAMVFIGPDDILITQKNDGKVRRVIGSILQSGQVLDVGVDSQSERGLLGMALHPAFPSPPFVYLYYTESGSPTGADSSGQAGEQPPVANRVYQRSRLARFRGSSSRNHNLVVMAFASRNIRNLLDRILRTAPDW